MNDIKYIELKAEFLDFEDREVKIVHRFQKPTTSQLGASNKAMQKSPERAFKNLLLQVVHPDEAEAFKQACEDYPGVVVTFADEIYKRVGYGSLGK